MSIAKLREKSAITVQKDNNNSKLLKQYVPYTTTSILRIDPFIPTISTNFRKPIYRSYSTLSSCYFKRISEQKQLMRIGRYPERGIQQRRRSKSSLSTPAKALQNGVCRIVRVSGDQQKLPDRINYDRRGLTAIPIFENEQNLRLLSLQHNLINVFHVPDDSAWKNPRQMTTTSIKDNEGAFHNDIDMNNTPIIQGNGPSVQLQAPTNTVGPLNISFMNLHNFGVKSFNITSNGIKNAGINTMSNETLMTNTFAKKAVLLHSVQNYGKLQKSKSFMNPNSHHINAGLRQNIQKGSPYGRNGFNKSVNNLPSFSGEVDNMNGLEQHEKLMENPDIQALKVKNNQLNPSYGNIFETLVFLDLYDNQIEKISNLDGLKSLSVLLLGKNRIFDISGLTSLKNTLRVLDLHGNKISNISNKINCLHQLKSLNLAGNLIRQINHNDFMGMSNLKELNLKRNRIKRVFGFHHLTSLERLWLCHNDIHRVEEMSSIGEATSLQEVTIENNPVSLAGECVSFLVSYLPNLLILSQMPITDQVRMAATTWRKNKEMTNENQSNIHSMMGNIRREEVIYNARTNWELLRSQQIQSTKNYSSKLASSSSSLQIDIDDRGKGQVQDSEHVTKVDPAINKINQIKRSPDKRKHVKTQKNFGIDTKTAELFCLPSIEQCFVSSSKTSSEKTHSSSSSLGPNLDSSSSYYTSDENEEVRPENPQQNIESSTSNPQDIERHYSVQQNIDDLPPEDKYGTDEVVSLEAENNFEVASNEKFRQIATVAFNEQKFSPVESKTELTSNNFVSSVPFDKSSSLYTGSLKLDSDISSSLANQNEKPVKPRVCNATSRRYMHGTLIRSQTTRAKASALVNNLSSNHQNVLISMNNQTPAVSSASSKPTKPIIEREREQGGDYLIEICGRYLNIYGLGALRFIEKQWNTQKANDVHILNFSYVNFNSIASILGRIKCRFPNAESYVFRETNISTLGQLNALAELQGISSLIIDHEGNPICLKNWRLYAIYRLSHWGLKTINNAEVTDAEIEIAHREYLGLSDLVLWSLPESLLQPLLARLRLEETCSASKLSAKEWLMEADHSLKVVVGKEALQWKRRPSTTSSALLTNHSHTEQCNLRDRANLQLTVMIENTCNAANKLQKLEKLWPNMLLDIVRNTLLDYSQIDVYVKNLMAEIIK